jgi:ribose-phosphate pyrophosphokinase
VDGKNVIMVDDLTETAGTLTNAATLLRKYGAKDIYTGVSHAVFTEIAHERLIKSEIKELITTDSTPVRLHPKCHITVLSIAEVLAEGIHRIYTNESVSSLFEINAKQI